MKDYDFKLNFSHNFSGNCSTYGPELFSDSNRLEITRKHFPEVNATFDEPQQTKEKWNNFSDLLRINSERIPLAIEGTRRNQDGEKGLLPNQAIDTTGKEVYNRDNCKTEGVFLDRTVQHIERRRTSPLTQVFEIRKLEDKLASSRKIKFDKRIESLRCPLQTKSTKTLFKKELFTPSIISLISANVREGCILPKDDDTNQSGTFYNKYLQLLPADGADKLRKRSDMEFPKPIKTKRVLPTLEPKRSMMRRPKRKRNQFICKTSR